MEEKIKMWREELERQNASMGVMSVFDSMLVFIGEQQREITIHKNNSEGYRSNWIKSSTAFQDNDRVPNLKGRGTIKTEGF